MPHKIQEKRYIYDTMEYVRIDTPCTDLINDRIRELDSRRWKNRLTKSKMPVMLKERGVKEAWRGVSTMIPYFIVVEGDVASLYVADTVVSDIVAWLESHE